MWAGVEVTCSVAVPKELSHGWCKQAEVKPQVMGAQNIGKGALPERHWHSVISVSGNKRNTTSRGKYSRPSAASVSSHLYTHISSHTKARHMDTHTKDITNFSWEFLKSVRWHLPKPVLPVSRGSLAISQAFWDPYNDYPKDKNLSPNFLIML